MKIVNRAAFLAMPGGTVYSKYEPAWFDALCIKGETIYRNDMALDWFYQQIVDAVDANDSGEFGEKLDDSQENETSVALDFHCEGRDGCFDDHQLFAVWESEDVIKLIARLQETLK